MLPFRLGLCSQEDRDLRHMPLSSFEEIINPTGAPEGDPAPEWNFLAQSAFM